jgi:putative (di)nucleoside polyphosphate hydrolase
VSRSGRDERPYRTGVGILLLNPDSLALVGRRIGMAAHAWQMPQGGLDPGETPAAAARRELEEEVGTAAAEIIAESRSWLSYDLPAEVSRKVWGGRYRGQRQKWFAMRFTGADSDIDLNRHVPEFDAWKWVAPETLPALIIPFKRPLYQAILDEFRPHIGSLERVPSG